MYWTKTKIFISDYFNWYITKIYDIYINCQWPNYVALVTKIFEHINFVYLKMYLLLVESQFSVQICIFYLSFHVWIFFLFVDILVKLYNYIRWVLLLWSLCIVDRSSDGGLNLENAHYASRRKGRNNFIWSDKSVKFSLNYFLYLA